jgi:two-component system, OmpR family, response regulator
MAEPTVRRILVVEDDPTISDLLRDYLEVEGYATDVCRDGAKAVERIRSDVHDLVLLDLMLPGLDGFDVLRLARGATDAPILVVSARREDIDKIRAFGLGADDYVAKPFSPGELMARVKAHLSKVDRLKSRYTEPEAEIRTIAVRGLEVQPQARRVLVHGREVSLAQKEFDLLLFLLRNPDRVFSKTELFEHCWGVDATGDTSTVTVHIARIREKIETHPEDAQYIETVWGAGYRFRA